MGIIYASSVYCVLSCIWLVTGGVKDPGPGLCSYSFHVWRADKNTMKQLEEVKNEYAQAIARLSKTELSVKNEFLEEILQQQNFSHQFQKDILELKLKDADILARVKDMSHGIRSVKNFEKDAQQSMTNIKQTQSKLKSKYNALKSDTKSVKKTVEGNNVLMIELNNRTGDLKAEWLLIKREMQNIRAENLQIKHGQNDIQSEIFDLEEGIADQKSDILNLSNKQEQLDEKVSSLQSYAEGTHKEVIKVKDAQSDIRLENVKLQQQVMNVNRENIFLKQEMQGLKTDNLRLRRKFSQILSKNFSLPDLHVGRLQPERDVPGVPPIDCQDVYKRGFTVSGVYEIKPDFAAYADQVYCQMINNTGWTLIQRRIDGSQKFDRLWLEYKIGFGNLYGEFWLGNEKLHQLTKQDKYMLRVDMWDWAGNRTYAEYKSFSVSDESDNYRLHVLGYSGNAGDSLSYHDKMKFSTEDMDNDYDRSSCAQQNKGGWWYNSCYSSNLNGKYYFTGWYTGQAQTYADGIAWFTLKKSEYYSLKKVEMKIRPLWKSI